MLEALMKLSNVRALLVGAVAIDTLCLGTLASLLVTNGHAATFDTGVLILTALAITSPVLAVSVGMSMLVVPAFLGAEERARRCLLAGSVMHGGVQVGALLQSCCGSMPNSIPAYFAETFALTFITMLLMTALTLSVRNFASKRRPG